MPYRPSPGFQRSQAELSELQTGQEAPETRAAPFRVGSRGLSPRELGQLIQILAPLSPRLGSWSTPNGMADPYQDEMRIHNIGGVTSSPFFAELLRAQSQPHHWPAFRREFGHADIVNLNRQAEDPAYVAAHELGHAMQFNRRTSDQPWNAPKATPTWLNDAWPMLSTYPRTVTEAGQPVEAEAEVMRMYLQNPQLLRTLAPEAYSHADTVVRQMAPDRPVEPEPLR